MLSLSKGLLSIASNVSDLFFNLEHWHVTFEETSSFVNFAYVGFIICRQGRYYIHIMTAHGFYVYKFHAHSNRTFPGGSCVRLFHFYD